jgi:antibiotic biosynthesis monooxygenase (ABM) superfamily enzyme
MIEHVVLFRLKPEASAADVDAMLEALHGLKAKIPGIVDLTAGTNFSDRAKGYTHGLVVRFQDRAALDAYIPHAEHQAVVQQRIRPIMDDVLAVDYEIG